MSDAAPMWNLDKPVFDKEKITLIFVLGGPGSGGQGTRGDADALTDSTGKGTQCANMVRDYGFKHLSAGDLLRAEQERPGSQYGELIKNYIKEGLIVPYQVTIKLLENAMAETLANPPTFPADANPALANGWKDGRGRFLIDGFPRKMDQAEMFDKAIVQNCLVLFIDTTQEVMIDRIIERSKTSGRIDDNRESLAKRFVTFVETSMPVVEHYREAGLCATVDSTPPVDVVYTEIKKVLNERLPSLLSA